MTEHKKNGGGGVLSLKIEVYKHTHTYIHIYVYQILRLATDRRAAATGSGYRRKGKRSGNRRKGVNGLETEGRG